MNINENLDLIDDILDAAWTVPLSGGRSVVDIDKVREAIDDIRLNMPAEIKQAKLIVSDRNIIIDDARKEASSVLKITEERAKKLVETSEIVRQSQERAKEIINQTNAQNRELKRATNEFIENMLKNSEGILMNAVQEIRTTRQAMKMAPKQQVQQQKQQKQQNQPQTKQQKQPIQK